MTFNKDEEDYLGHLRSPYSQICMLENGRNGCLTIIFLRTVRLVILYEE